MSGGEVSVVWGKRRPTDREWSNTDEDDGLITPTPAVTVRKRKRKGGPALPTNLPCQYHNAIFSPFKVSYYVLECLGPGVPTSQLYATSLPQPKLLMHLQNNTYVKVGIKDLSHVFSPGGTSIDRSGTVTPFEMR